MFSIPTNFAINIAVLVDHRELTAFEAEVLADILKSCDARLRLVLEHDTRRTLGPLDWCAKHILLRGSQELKPANDQFIRDIKYLEITEHTNLDIAIKALGIDLVISFTENLYLHDALEALPLGVLRYEFGASPAQDEIAQTDWLQTVALKRYRHHAGGWRTQAIKSGVVRRLRHSLSGHYDGVLSAIKSWLPQAITFTENSSPYEASATASSPEIGWASRLGTQFNILRATFFRKCWRMFLFQKWHIAIVERPVTDFLKNGLDFERKWLPRANKNSFLADPFPIMHDGQLQILVENYSFSTGLGVIEAISFDNNQQPKQAAVLKLPSHISYPSMIVDQQKLYCLPETLGEKEVALYQCLKFPGEWAKVQVLLPDQYLSDPTLFEFEGKWWLFATRFDSFSGGNDQLFAWHSQDIKGPWQPHNANPIKVDVGSSRSAGAPFSADGRLYRPAQSCRYRYGEAIVINEILKLNENEFVEQEISRIMPEQSYPQGCHHIAGYGNVTVIDGQYEEFSLLAPYIKALILWRRRQWGRRRRKAPISIVPDVTIDHRSLNAEDFKIQNVW